MGLSLRQRMLRRQVRQTLYRLRRRWGVQATLYEVVPGSFDPELGTVSETKTVHVIPQLVTWYVTEQQRFEYDLAFVAANKNFTYGATFEMGDRFAIVDGVYLPDTFNMTESCYFVYDAVRYSLQRWTELDGKAGYLVHIRSTNVEKPEQIIQVHVEHGLTIDHDISGTTT